MLQGGRPGEALVQSEIPTHEKSPHPGMEHLLPWLLFCVEANLKWYREKSNQTKEFVGF